MLCCYYGCAGVYVNGESGEIRVTQKNPYNKFKVK